MTLKSNMKIGYLMETSATCSDKVFCTIGIQDTQFLKLPKFTIAIKFYDIIVLLQTLVYY